MTDLNELRDRIRRLSDEARPAWGTVSSGWPTLDARLPARGFRRGTLVEWLASEPGAGTTLCALHGAREASAAGRPLVVVDSDDTFHPPGLSAVVDWRRLLLVRGRTSAEVDWAVDQALRTSGVGAVLVRFDRIDERRLRRWQLAAERSGAIGFIVRHLPHPPEACFSDVRIATTPLVGGEGRRLRLQLLRSRQGGGGAALEIRIDDHASALPAIAPSERRSARA